MYGCIKERNSVIVFANIMHCNEEHIHTLYIFIIYLHTFYNHMYDCSNSE